ncbi:heat shock protein Hsp90 [Coccomyxa subellipsoidea C-169]|uniref:Heat shock protein Hsp90 n=1 Tax=Coccomyxa subellipsoidea (strain C-169) TaxID=574566 RepID=I0YLQ6_COCSC|nr:heat shock protein Hsp90 [Coccomyxa subellipsoidea C-169]EIE19325.1 heat shock protein Hsp90 [Coccomyxa subellipsoidea C-169]|eukprot:XP_005643869.1 heat shock protein Hsp90 [Coccomyxa subellipsoidea C-169]
MHVCAAAATETKEETFTYQAEVDRLMDLIVNSLYSNREVFLRELVSNASDALDKLRFLSLTDSSVMAGEDAMEIRIKADSDARTIVIEDTGVGMTREDLLSSLGTIAKSGTAKFAEAVKESQGDANLIGQFGVGFYSAFLVADKVTVQTKNAADPSQWYWQSSSGSHQFVIREDEAKDLPRGTRITLHLKDDATELADAAKLGDLIKQYSEFIQFPIRLWSSKTEYEQVVDDEATKEKQAKADEEAKEAGKEAADPVEPATRSESKEVWDWRVQNDNKPLWTRTPKEIEQAEYNNFFKTTFREFLEPLAQSHFNVEGTIEFSALLFVPGMAPFEQQDWLAKSRNIRLFVKRVFISDEFDDDLMPRYLSFMKGIVDSSDLPLNVSREILQESRVVRVIKKQLVKRTLETLKEIAGRPEKDGKSDYETFWDSFGKFIKLGAIEDQANKKQIAELLRFPSSKSGDAMISLQQYVGRAKEGQKSIFYIAADSLSAAASAPFVEQLIKKDLEVLYLTEPIDEPAINNIGEFNEFKFVDVTREGLDLGDIPEEEKKKAEETTEALKPLTDFLKSTLGERVEKVAVSQRLTDSPCALVTSQFGWSAYQERVMRSQTLGDSRAAEYMKGRKTLEINPDHPIIRALSDKVNNDAAGAKAVAELMYDTALVTSGFTVESPREFAARIYNMVGLAVNASPAAADAAAAKPVIDPEILGADPNDPWKEQ